ncbi:MAG: TrmH family RNA methyltransferase [Coprobacillaceae bacterium]
MITSVNNATIKELVKLKQKKYRDETGYYLVEGVHLVEEAINAKQAIILISTKEIKSDLEVLVVSEEVMKKIAFTKQPQSVMAKCKIVKKQMLIETNRYLLLDSLQDPGNVGTLIRTALAFGIKQVILSPTCVDIYNDKVLRSMQGANFYISCIYQKLEEVIPVLQNNNVYVVGSALENGTAIETIIPNQKMAYIVGNEGNGMRKEIMSICDHLAYIPISNIESLNVAVAGSIMMYYFKEK